MINDSNATNNGNNKENSIFETEIELEPISQSEKSSTSITKTATATINETKENSLDLANNVREWINSIAVNIITDAKHSITNSKNIADQNKNPSSSQKNSSKNEQNDLSPMFFQNQGYREYAKDQSRLGGGAQSYPGYKQEQPNQLYGGYFSEGNTSSSHPSRQINQERRDFFGRPPLGEEHENAAISFSEDLIRRAFIQKVFLLIACQIAITFSLILTIRFFRPATIWILNNYWLVVIAIAMYFYMAFILCCCSQLYRHTPKNYFLLSIFTISLTLIFAYFTFYFEADAVLIAMGTTAIVCFATALFAILTRLDFTLCYGLILSILIVFCVGIVIYLFLPKSKTENLVFSSIGVIAFILLLIKDVQMIMGGRHRIAFSPEDYVIAAISVYFDIMLIFLFVLQILGNAN